MFLSNHQVDQHQILWKSNYPPCLQTIVFSFEYVHILNLMKYFCLSLKQDPMEMKRKFSWIFQISGESFKHLLNHLNALHESTFLDFWNIIILNFNEFLSFP